MANGYTYEIRLRDLMTAGLNRAKTAAGSFNQKMVEVAQRTRSATSQSASSINQLNQKLATLQTRRDSAFSTKQIGIYNRSIRQTEKQLQRLNNLPSPGILGRFRQMGSKIGSLIGLTGGLALAMAGIGAVGGIVKMGAELEQTRISFQTMMGSVDKGNKMIKDITSLGAATPFGNKELQDNAKLLLNFGVEGQKVIPTLRTLGDVSGGNVERLNGLTLAYAQVSSAGKLQGQDLLQMINAGFNPLNEIAKITGESLGSLKDKMSAGGISAKMVELAFQSATSQGGMFNNMMEKQSQTLGGKWSTFLDTVMDKAAIFGESMSPYLSALIGYATSILDALFAVPTMLKNIYMWLSKNKMILAGLTLVVAGLTSGWIIAKSVFLAATIATKAQVLWMGLLTVATHGLSTAIKNIPVIGWVIAIIGLVILAISYLVDHWDWFVAKWKAGWTLLKNGAQIGWIAVKTSFSLMGIDMQILWNKFKGFGQWIGGFFSNIGKSIKLAFSGDFNGAKKALFAPIKVAANDEISRLHAEKKKVLADAKSQGAKLLEQSVSAALIFNGSDKKNAHGKKADQLISKKSAGQKTQAQLKAEMEAELSGNSGNGKVKSKGKSTSLSGSKDKANEIITGGKKSLVYNINIENVVKDIVQNISTGKESADSLVDEILDKLTRRLHGTFRAAAE